MKLKTLRLHGFKSFADVTEIHFHEGITAVVGPNGCGKSNISDAVRWVLGEQRPTAIRGAKMEEAIFQGTVLRRPVNRGAVTMVVTNDDGTLPVPFEEVEVARTVYRDGRSDYSLNRSGVRLRDVVDLVRDTGLGANAYNIIEQRMIDAILSDRAEERRALFEEASGIGKYKDRRKSASRRLERAEMDLQRLEDVIAEVESKVRSLARQKGKAERYLKLRERRLSVEVAVVKRRLAELQRRRTEVDRELTGGKQLGEGMVAELRAAEARAESLRLEQAEAEQTRRELAARLEEVRQELVRWERELAVAEERAAYAQRRLGQIDHERRAARERGVELQAEVEALVEKERRAAAELESVTADLEESRKVAGQVRARLDAARAASEAVEAREREVARLCAQMEGDAQSAEAQAAELERRLVVLEQEMDTTAATRDELEVQGDLFGDRLEGLAVEVARAEQALERTLDERDAAKASLTRLREAERAASDLAMSLRAQVQALGELDREGEGASPVAAAAQAAGIEGVFGVLLDSVEATGDATVAIERFLGSLGQGLVVRDSRVAAALHRWFREEWEGGGGLTVLPLDALPPPGEAGSLLDAVSVGGKGEPWLRVLLAGVDFVEGEDLDLDRSPGPALAPGVSRDRIGVVRIGNPAGPAGVLERRERLKRLGVRAEESQAAAEVAREAREKAERQMEARDAELEAARTALREVEDVSRQVQGDAAQQVDSKARIDRHHDELARQIEGARAARSRALERAARAREDRQALLAEEEDLVGRRSKAREVLGTVQDEWEVARAAEAKWAVRTAQLEGEVGRLQERLEAVRGARREVDERVTGLDQEEADLEGELDAVGRLREEGAAATASLFTRRDEGESALREASEALEEVGESLRVADATARQVRSAEREASDRRHALELERQEVEGRIGRIRDRLEGEWGRPLEALLEDAEPVSDEELADPQRLEEELREIVEGMDRIGLVNMLAVEEHQEESERLSFLKEQHDDLVEARDDLRAAIRRINETATGLFNETFAQIRDNFRLVHTRLFEGGEADIWLEDEGDPLESTVEIHASPKGKKTQRIDLLSGGERALTALALLFAIYLVKPSPFCVFDEVDAPLDENNIGRFLKLLEEFKPQTQFIVITHNPRTIEAADWIYGVTMEEPGVSTIVGVKLEEALDQARGAA